MTDERYVVIGLAQVRAPWFADISRWATGGMAPIEFVKCVSIEETRARLGSGRAFSALLLDGHLPGIDRDLIELAADRGCCVLVVDTPTSLRDWVALGASATLTDPPTIGNLLGALDDHARLIGEVDRALPTAPVDQPTLAWRGRLFAVTGPGGSGTSLTAMALAQGLGNDPRNRGMVLLADLSLDADQAMLHDARDIVPGLQELVEAFRSGAPGAEEIRSLTFTGDRRSYSLLLGLRRHRDWVAIRPRAFEAALDGLRRTFTAVVADMDPDVEGEQDTGSVDVEERNLLARSAASSADLVIVTLTANMRGLHRGVRVIEGLLRLGVPIERVLPAVTNSPRGPRRRAEIASALHDLTAPLLAASAKPAPVVFLPGRQSVDQAMLDGRPLPGTIASAIADACRAAAERLTDSPLAGHGGPEPDRIAPGSLGTWLDQEATG